MAVVALVISGTVLGLMARFRGALLPVPIRLVALKTTGNTPLCVGVPTIWPAALTDSPVGRPLAAYPVMTAFVALIWIGAMALPTVPASVGIVAVTSGTDVGRMLKVTVNGALVPAALVTVRLTLPCPLRLGVPVIAPVPVFRVRPAGSTPGATTAKPSRGG